MRAKVVGRIASVVVTAMAATFVTVGTAAAEGDGGDSPGRSSDLSPAASGRAPQPTIGSAQQRRSEIAAAVREMRLPPKASNPKVSFAMSGAFAASLATPTGTVRMVPEVRRVEGAVSHAATGSDAASVKSAAGTSAVTLQSTAHGLRGLISIDSAEAPERYRFTIGGDVAKLVKNPDGSVTALDGDDAPVAIATPPWAVDAKGAPVPTHYEVDGTNLYQVVDHHAGNFAYGIVADPQLVPLKWWNPFSWPWGKWLHATWNALRGGLEACGKGALLGVLGVPVGNGIMKVIGKNINPNVSILKVSSSMKGTVYTYVAAAAASCILSATAHEAGW